MKNLFWIICLFASGFSNISFAEDTEILEDVPPPPSISLGAYNFVEPAGYIKKKNGEFIEEYRVNGQLYMMKVTPKNMPAYYLYKDTSGSDWKRYDDMELAIIPQWVILTF